jgi:hypothetical protein
MIVPSAPLKKKLGIAGASNGNMGHTKGNERMAMKVVHEEQVSALVEKLPKLSNLQKIGS